MNKNDIKTKLEEEKGVLLGELDSFAKQDENGIWVPVPTELGNLEPDLNDAADRDEDFEERASKTEILSKRLKDVDTALTNLDTEKYGMCVECNAKIEEDRLEANPAAQTCKACMNS